MEICGSDVFTCSDGSWVHRVDVCLPETNTRQENTSHPRPPQVLLAYSPDFSSVAGLRIELDHVMEKPANCQMKKGLDWVYSCRLGTQGQASIWPWICAKNCLQWFWVLPLAQDIWSLGCTCCTLAIALLCAKEESQIIQLALEFNSLMLASLLSSWQLHWRVIHLASPLQPELIGLCRFRGKGKWWFQITISNKYLMLHLRSASLGWPLSSESAALGARERGPSGKHPRCGPSLVNAATPERNESRHPLSKSKVWFLHRQSLPNPPIPAETHALGHRRLWSQFGAPIAMPLKISLESTDIHSIDGRLLKYTSVRRTPEQLQLSSHLPRGRGFLAAPQHSWDGQDGKGRQTVGGNVLQDWHLEH